MFTLLQALAVKDAPLNPTMKLLLALLIRIGSFQNFLLKISCSIEERLSLGSFLDTIWHISAVIIVCGVSKQMKERIRKKDYCVPLDKLN